MECVLNESIWYDTGPIKKRLKDYQNSYRWYNRQLQRLERMEERLVSIGSPSHIKETPTSHCVNDRMADAVAVKVDLERQLDLDRIKLKEERNNLERITKMLMDADEKTVIYARYLDFTATDKENAWQQVSFVLFGDQSDYLEREDSYLRQTYRIHQMALYHLAELLQKKA